jgi:Na+-driven multidrug efflux pump
MEYTPSIPVLQILVWALVPYTINNFLSLAFLVDVREPIITGALTISLLCLFLFTIWWGQNSGALGTAWAVVSAETIQCIILSFRAMRHREWFSFKGSDFKGSDFKGSDLKGSDLKGSGNEFSNLS